MPKSLGAVVVVGVLSVIGGVPQASGQERSVHSWLGDAKTSWFNESALPLCDGLVPIGIGGGTLSERLERLNAQYESDLAIVRRIKEATSTYPRTMDESKQRDQELKGYFDALLRRRPR